MAKPDAAPTPQKPTAYRVFQVVDNKWIPQPGIHETTRGGEHACHMAATLTEADGKPRSGNFVAVPASRITGKNFVKEMQPVVEASAFDPFAEPEKMPEPPANGRAAETVEQEPVTA